jgi:chromosome segregation ATPase
MSKERINFREGYSTFQTQIYDTSLCMNAKITENLYKNQMSDLEVEFKRTQGQINQLQGQYKYNIYDIEAIKRQNKSMAATVERYKDILKDHKEKKKENEKELKMEESAFKRYKFCFL